MNDQRKKIIMTEINYWKKNKLLPEHYCDFLITLYTRGDQEGEIKLSDAILVRDKKKGRLSFIVFILLALAVGGSLFLIKDHFVVTLSLAAIVTIGMLARTIFGKTIQRVMAPLLYILSAFLLLAMSLKTWSVFFEGQTTILIGLLILNCLLWLFAGRLLKLLYFTLSGAAGLLLITGFIFKMMV